MNIRSYQLDEMHIFSHNYLELEWGCKCVPISSPNLL